MIFQMISSRDNKLEEKKANFGSKLDTATASSSYGVRWSKTTVFMKYLILVEIGDFQRKSHNLKKFVIFKDLQENTDFLEILLKKSGFFELAASR